MPDTVRKAIVDMRKVKMTLPIDVEMPFVSLFLIAELRFELLRANKDVIVDEEKNGG